MPVELISVIVSIACPVAYLLLLSRNILDHPQMWGIYGTAGINDQALICCVVQYSSPFGGISRIIFPMWPEYALAAAFSSQSCACRRI
jgi:hypothetical protein